MLQLEGDDKKSSYLKKIVQPVYLKDIEERHTIDNKPEFRELLKVLASGVGSPTNASNIANTISSVKKLSLSDKTVPT